LTIILRFHHAVDEFGLLLNPHVRMAIAELAGGERGQLGLVGGKALFMNYRFEQGIAD
jgi:hypothetical protein